MDEKGTVSIEELRKAFKLVKKEKEMNEYTVYLKKSDEDEVPIEIFVNADEFEMDFAHNMVFFKVGVTYVAMFRVDEIIGIANNNIEG